MAKWMQEAFKHSHKGALHRQLGIPINNKIPKYILEHIVNSKVGHSDMIYGYRVTITALLKKRAQFLLNVEKK